METTIISRDRSLAERRFYVGVALAMLLSVLLGFARSFFLRPLFPGHPSPAEPIFYVHGAIFSMWMLMFVLQTSLIARGRVRLHRQAGIAGGILVVLMVVVGTMSALEAASRPTGFVGVPVPPLQFLAVPLFDMVLFSAFIAMAFAKRNNTQSHKRWMLLATLNLITAAVARWPVVGGLGVIFAFGITDLFVVSLAIWDYRSRGRLHPVTLYAGLLFIISQPLRLFVSGSDTWLVFAEWATSLTR